MRPTYIFSRFLLYNAYTSCFSKYIFLTIEHEYNKFISFCSIADFILHISNFHVSCWFLVTSPDLSLTKHSNKFLTFLVQLLLVRSRKIEYQSIMHDARSSTYSRFLSMREPCEYHHRLRIMGDSRTTRVRFRWHFKTAVLCDLRLRHFVEGT